MNRFQVCTHCVMDTTAEEITFDDSGVCSFCRQGEERVRLVADRVRSGVSAKALQEIVSSIRRSGDGKPYDSILGLSGGTDSSYLAHIAVEFGLRPLFVHVDTGWNTALSVQNVLRLVRGLGRDLEEVTIDWEEMRDLQLAFYRSSVANCDIPQDHAFLAALYNVAAAKGVKYILGGQNIATESILPKSWGYDAGDARHLMAIHRTFGSAPLRNYPVLGFWDRYVYYRYVRRIRELPLLDHLDYNKARAMEVLGDRYGWEAYGAKHYETVQTRFFQGYYLPRKFGIDKRKAHLSSLIVSGQISREEALDELRRDPYPSPELLQEDMRTMAKRLGVSVPEFMEILDQPPRRHEEFPSQRFLFRAKDSLVKILGLRVVL